VRPISQTADIIGIPRFARTGNEEENAAESHCQADLCGFPAIDKL
jgi:hypothetical protein